MNISTIQYHLLCSSRLNRQSLNTEYFGTNEINVCIYAVIIKLNLKGIAYSAG